MVGEDKKYIRTWEELIMDRLGQAFHAKDQNNPELFDSILEEVEMLLKLVPSMYNELEAVKGHKKALVQTGIKKAKEKAMSCPDDITKEFVYRKELYTVQWDYRSDLLETILTILGAYQKIPFTDQQVAEIAAIKPTVDEDADIEEDVEDEEPEEKPVKFTPIKE